MIEFEGNQGTSIKTRINDKTYRHSLNELVDGSRSHYLSGFVSPSVCFNQAVLQAEYQLHLDLKHNSASETRDRYYLGVHQ